MAKKKMFFKKKECRENGRKKAATNNGSWQLDIIKNMWEDGDTANTPNLVDKKIFTDEKGFSLLLNIGFFISHL